MDNQRDIHQIKYQSPLLEYTIAPVASLIYQ